MRHFSLVLVGFAQGAYPGPEYLHPKIHYSSEALHRGGWHDIAGAITLGTGEDTVHHIFQGCGWNHAMSKDLVHWTDMGIGPKTVHEQHAGLDSTSTPCSGYVTVDDEDGTVCAGFRQCGSKHGVYGGQNWDVPLELRCAKDKNLTDWGDHHPIWLFDVFFYRGIPYDPARPWKEDGRWYQIISTDACNDTTRQSPCAEGGRLDLWSSPKLKTTEWEYHGHMFTSNKTVIPSGHLTKEMVTIDYLGNMPGDPNPSSDTRFFFNNVGGNGGGVGCCSGTTGYFKGKQSKSEPFNVDFSDPTSMGMVDWGSFTPLPDTDVKGVPGLSGSASRAYSMARTLGGDVNQVTGGGRRIMFAWLGETPASMSIGRDLSVNKDYELLQQFVPEMKMLRLKETAAPSTQQIEVIAKFSVPGGSELPPSPSPAKSGWTPVVSKGFYGEVDVGSDAFKKALATSPTSIIKRLCSSCSSTHREIYYKRLTPLPDDLDLFEVLKSNWTDYKNTLNKDFELYNDYAAAVEGRSSEAWQFCNFNDPSGVGAFRDCGPKGQVSNQWNSFSGRGGQDSVAFYVDATGSHPPPPSPALLPFGVEVLKGPGGEGTRIGVDPVRGLITVNGTTQGNGDVRAGPILPGNATEISIHAIIDHSIIEVIVNNQTALTVYVTPSSSNSVGLALYGTDGKNADKVSGSFQAWELAAANNLVDEADVLVV